MQSSASTGDLLGHLAAILHRQTDQILFERLGIGLSQYRILATLERWPASTQRTLAAMLGQTEASISRQIGLLRAKGLLATKTDPAERRRRLAALTAKGAKFTLAAREALEQFYSPLFANLKGRQQAHLHELLTSLHDNTCTPGQRLACDRPGDIETIYADQLPSS